MNEIEIKRHNFDLAKNRLKEFSETTEAELGIDKVRTDGGLFGLGDHKVTGYELNDRLETIQENFISVNRTNNKVIKEFREVYNALDVLDKEYITYIVANVKTIEKTSNDVKTQQVILKQHHETLASQQSKLNVHQTEIEKSVANISKIVTTLKAFKEKLEDYRHLTDIDKIWNDCKNIQNEIRVVSDSLTKISKKVAEDVAIAIDKIWSDCRNIQNEIRVVSDSVTKVSKKAAEDFATVNDKNETLSAQVNKDMLALRNEIKTFKKFYCDLSEKLEHTVNLLDAQIPVIQETASFVEHLQTVTHIDDIDSMWGDLDICKTDIKKINGNIKTHQNELDSIVTVSAEHTDKLNGLEQANGKMRETIELNEHNVCVLKDYMDKLNGISHLDDVDSIWKDVKEHVSKFEECERRDENLAVTIQKNKEEVKGNIAEAVETANAAIGFLTKKVKYAYWIAGGSVGLAIVELILLFMR